MEARLATRYRCHSSVRSLSFFVAIFSTVVFTPVTPGKIQHINQQWSYIFIHAWHTVFHDTYITSPTSNLIQTGNRALTNAYVRWEQLWPNDPILTAPITIDGVSMTAMRNYNAPTPIKPILTLFNRSFKNQVSVGSRRSLVSRVYGFLD